MCTVSYSFEWRFAYLDRGPDLKICERFTPWIRCQPCSWSEAKHAADDMAKFATQMNNEFVMQIHTRLLRIEHEEPEKNED